MVKMLEYLANSDPREKYKSLEYLSEIFYVYCLDTYLFVYGLSKNLE